ncbi:Ig-like domain (group 3) [Methanobrevibacter millerae]|uniref:Ig-like domain (Group 3) n=1 Tax=Methanobrevibacter millerae TaxID=230361 RepID=A0A1G5XBY5_9EURY|nr:Ig-like domain (group 3) [Methanobrevibacter millerae]
MTAGDKTIVVEYSGDDNYAPTQVISNLTVDKTKTTPDLIVVDKGNGTVVVVVGDNATGNVTVTVDGENYTAEVIDGVAVVNLDNLTPGTHDIQIAYSGDDNHAPSTAASSVNVPKAESPISVSVEDIYVGDTAVIEVKVADNATGNVTIEIDGVKYSSEIKGGKAVFEVPDLAKGTKTIAVDYVGDDSYLANHTTGTITVSKRPSFVNATITDIDVGENVTITVTVPEDATGQVLIDIDGVGYYVNVTNGVGVAQIPRMPNGVYDVNLTYTGDDKYESSSTKGLFNVSKVESFVIPVAQNITVGDLEVITLTVPQDATGIVTVVIDGVEYHFDLDEGKLLSPDESGDIYSVAISGGNGILVISGLPKGEYVVSAMYNGDAKYLPCTNTTIFTVSDKDPSIKIIDQNNGTVVVVLPEDATGNVTVTVDGKTFQAEVINGTAVINVDGLDPGEHEMTITYSGDDHYGEKTQTGTVNVPKVPAPISVSVDDIGVGQAAVVTVTLPDDATGNVTIEINAKKYTAEIVDGKAVFNVDGLAVGNKTVAVTYPGDDKYLSNFTTGQFEVSKVPANVTATSHDIMVGDEETIKATFPQDATGRALLRLGGEEYYADIVNGEAIFKVPNLASGEYEALLGYPGDENYEPSNTTTKFTVSKYSEPVSASGDSIEIGENGTVVVKLPIDATGTVTITVDGKTYTQEVVDGQAVFSIPGLQSGVHPVTVYYSGDAKYEANVTTTAIVVADNGNNTPGNGSDVPEKASEGISLSKYQTGNPIFVLLLILLIGGAARFRKSEE